MSQASYFKFSLMVFILRYRDSIREYPTFGCIIDCCIDIAQHQFIFCKDSFYKNHQA